MLSATNHIGEEHLRSNQKVFCASEGKFIQNWPTPLCLPDSKHNPVRRISHSSGRDF